MERTGTEVTTSGGLACTELARASWARCGTMDGQERRVLIFIYARVDMADPFHTRTYVRPRAYPRSLNNYPE